MIEVKVASLSQISPPKPRIHFYSVPYVLHAPPTSFFFLSAASVGARTLTQRQQPLW